MKGQFYQFPIIIIIIRTIEPGIIYYYIVYLSYLRPVNLILQIESWMLQLEPSIKILYRNVQRWKWDIKF